MPLTFKPDRAVYDPARGLMRFFATDGALLVNCGVSKNALVALNDGCTEGTQVLERIYERHRQRILDIAARKHRARQLEKDGTIVVRRRDIAA
ncbi:MAG TPA: DUF1488 family protein [Dongiaceae bacterium]|nr:DUF1488 family protein [Dongiaceae bacterium]